MRQLTLRSVNVPIGTQAEASAVTADAIRAAEQPRRYTGMLAYTRRRQRNGTVKVFLRDAANRHHMELVLDASAAAQVPPNQPLTIDHS